MLAEGSAVREVVRSSGWGVNRAMDVVMFVFFNVSFFFRFVGGRVVIGVVVAFASGEECIEG